MRRFAIAMWVASVVFLSISQASAQVNIERLRRDFEQENFSGSLELDLSARSGNVETVELGIGGRLDYASRTITTLLVGSGDWGWEGGERNSNQALIHLRQVYQRGSRLRPEAFVQFDYNKSRKLTSRGLLGSGLRIDLHQNDVVRISYGSSYVFEHERLDLAATDLHPRRTSVHRWSNYLSSRVVLGGQSTLAWTVYLQPQFNRLRDMRVLSETHLDVELSRPFFVMMSVRIRYDSQPPTNTESLDTTLKSGIAIEF